jgi:hypothetical protein
MSLAQAGAAAGILAINAVLNPTMAQTNASFCPDGDVD